MVIDFQEVMMKSCMKSCMMGIFHWRIILTDPKWGPVGLDHGSPGLLSSYCWMILQDGVP